MATETTNYWADGSINNPEWKHKFINEWREVCGILKSSGLDLSKIRLVGKVETTDEDAA